MNIHPQAVLRSGIKRWINVFLKVLFNWFPWILLSGIFPFTSLLSLCSLDGEKVTRIRRNLINLLIFFFLITWLSGHRLRCVFPFVIFTGMLTLAWKCCTIIFNHLPGVYVFFLTLLDWVMRLFPYWNFFPKFTLSAGNNPDYRRLLIEVWRRGLVYSGNNHCGCVVH